MKWLLLIPLTIAALILIVAIVGLFLPKSHRATRLSRFNQPPESIFAAIVGPQDWRNVTKTDLPTSAGPRQWREQSGRQSITFEEVTSDPPHLYRSKIADKNLPFSGTWTWEISPTPTGCTCRITEDGEVSNPLFRFVSRFILGQTKTIDDYLTALSNKFHEPPNLQP